MHLLNSVTIYMVYGEKKAEKNIFVNRMRYLYNNVVMAYLNVWCLVSSQQNCLGNKCFFECCSDKVR